MTVVRFPNGTVLDHIAFAVPDTRLGCEQLEELTGVAPHLMSEPEPGAYYWSGGLNLGGGQMLEVLGPNPAFQGFHPFHALLSSITEPRLLFWYILVDDMATYGQAAAAAGRPLTTVETVDPEDQTYSAYSRASLSGPLDPVVPNVIRWTRRRKAFTGDAGEVTLSAFRLGHPDHQELTELFARLDIAQAIAPAPTSVLELELNTPRGVVTLRGEGNLAAGFSLPPGNN
jgi:hypothetical protein